jgi:hypothetical protein
MPDEVFLQLCEAVYVVCEEERALLKHLVVDLELFTTSPSFSITPLSNRPIEGGFMHCLQTLCSIVCKDGSPTQPPSSELKKVSLVTSSAPRS